MVELPELNEDQRIFLLTIFDYFHEEGKWPTYLWVENTIRKSYPAQWPKFDMVEVCKSLPDNFATGFSFNHQYGQDAAFIVPVLYYFDEAKEEIDDFIRVLGFCVEKINASDEERPAISSNDLSSRLDMQPLAIRKMGLLLQGEPQIFNGSSANEEWWQINLQRGKDGVRHFEGVKSFEQYLERRTALTYRFSGKVAVQPVQNEPAIDVPILDTSQIGTQYHIVQGDQYNISGNAGDVKVKSPSIDVAASKKDHRSPWMSGSFYLIVFIVIIAALSVAGRLLPLYALPIVLMGGILALSTIGAFQLRQDERLSEENFLKLMALSFKYLPWLKRKDAKSNESGNQLY